MRAPESLAPRGRALWRSIAGGLPKGWELDEREVAILTMAARQADDVERLERIVNKDGAMVEGSAGQPVLHPALVEARQGRLAVQRLLGQLELPDAEEEPRSEAGKRGQRGAAHARWDRRANVEARRRPVDGERPALEAAELRSRLHWLIQSQGLPCDPPNARQQRFFQEVADESARLERAGLPLAEQVAGVEAFLADRGALGRAEGLLGNLARGRGAS